VQQGDIIELDVPNRRLHLDVPEAELAQRRKAWQPAPPQADRGYVGLYVRHVQQAHLGADMDFLRGNSGSEVKRDSH
jgi:L-arabonate dehydrase